MTRMVYSLKQPTEPTLAYWIYDDTPPDPSRADDDGLVALGGSLEPSFLLSAYRAGCFPWSSRPVLNWWCPEPRLIFELPAYRPHKSVLKRIRQEGWTFAVNRSFRAVMEACASTRADTWITPDILDAYAALHRLGNAHSFEVYEGGQLIGGLYGVSIGGYFGGESMFHLKTDASKAAVSFFIERLNAAGYTLLDAQAPTPHLLRLGAVEINRSEYLSRLQRALLVSPLPL
jgi:leucyl/phenylalanyl-tRNA---protein transferase